MTRRKQSAQRPEQAESRRNRQERDAEEIQNLPNREAMSILSGFPTIPGLPAGLLGDQSGLPAPDGGAPAPADPGAQSTGDINTISPTNQSTLTNLNSAGTTETTGATQDVPIIQR